MCLLRIKWSRVGLLFCAALICGSCGFVDLRPVGFSVEPGISGVILPGEYTPVTVTFDTEMEKPSAESILKISSAAGMIEGDTSWQGNQLCFVPVSSWTAGTRYTLSLSGFARAADGRELRIEKHIFYYAINKSCAPMVETFSPADGACLEVQNETSPSGVTDNAARLPAVVEIRFSCPMDRLSTETAFSAEGFSGDIFRWSDDDHVLEIIPEKKLSPWMVYRWTLKTSAKSREGVPLAKAVSAQFSTDYDRVIPVVEEVYPVMKSNGMWAATGGGIEKNLGTGQSIAIRFNKPMSDNALNSVRFDPSLPGKTEMLSETCIVFIPGRDPLPETVYTLIVSADAKDASGLRMGSEYRTRFTADIPYLRVISFNSGEVSVSGDSDIWEGERALAVPVDALDGGTFRFTIRFSLPFDMRAKQDAALKITLVPFFPGNLPPAALRFVSWISEDMMRMEWEGLKPGTASAPAYYLLTLPGGRGGIETGGMYLRENRCLYLEAQ